MIEKLQAFARNVMEGALDGTWKIVHTFANGSTMSTE